MQLAKIVQWGHTNDKFSLNKVMEQIYWDPLLKIWKEKKDDGQNVVSTDKGISGFFTENYIFQNIC